MAVSDVQIARLALQHIGDRFDITSLSEATPEAEQVNLVYENVRDALLREHPWKFSLRYVKPASLSGTPPAYWSYMYAYPSDALRIWRIVNPLDPRGVLLPPIEWTIGRNSSDAKVLLTEEAEPEFEYTKLITDAVQYDSNFVMALSWRLAAHIARPITGDANLARAILQEGESWVGIAKANDANESVMKEPDRAPDWMRARG